MALSISVAAQDAMCNALVDLLDVGTTDATGDIEIRAGAKPATVGTTATGTLLATLTFSNPAFGNSSSGTANANPIVSDTSVDASGTAGYFRCRDRNNTAVIDGTITATSGGGDMEFNNTSFVAGGTASITSMSVTQPAS